MVSGHNQQHQASMTSRFDPEILRWLEARKQFKNIVCEVRPNKFRHKHVAPDLVPLRYRTASGERFRSFMGYPVQTSTRVNSQRSTVGITEMPVYCDMVFIDIDDPRWVAPVRAILRSQGLYFAEYTARRGAHFHVLVMPICGPHVAWSVKCWLFSLFEPEMVDTSMIHAAGQIRLANSVHEKDGSIKTHVKTYIGNIIRIPIVKRSLAITTKRVSDLSKEDIEHSNHRYSKLIRERPRSGNRYPSLYKIVQNAVRAGIDSKVMMKQIHWWNSRCYPPHDINYINHSVERILRQIR